MKSSSRSGLSSYAAKITELFAYTIAHRTKTLIVVALWAWLFPELRNANRLTPMQEKAELPVLNAQKMETDSSLTSDI